MEDTIGSKSIDQGSNVWAVMARRVSGSFVGRGWSRCGSLDPKSG